MALIPENTKEKIILWCVALAGFFGAIANFVRDFL